MGLPKPLGPFSVAFADFHLRRSEVVNGGDAAACIGASQRNNNAGSVSLATAPLMRVFYPTSQEKTDLMENLFHCSSRWIPSLMYTWGYISKMIPPSSSTNRFAIWILAGLFHSFMCTGVLIPASVGGPIIPVRRKDEEGRLPVVVFSHGLWACRTTYTSFCYDLASHGYVVVAVEHLDGSANMAYYVDQDGKSNWLKNAHADIPISEIKMEERTVQLSQRAIEVCSTIDVLECLDQGKLTQNDNIFNGKAALDVDMLRGRLDLDYVAVSGHSFGGATAIVASGIDKRIKCCLAMDVWWEPINKVQFEKLAGKVPVLLLNTETFDWKELQNARIMFMKARANARRDGRALITELKTIKGTSHQNQSDFPIVFPWMMKKIGLAGELDPLIARNVNNKTCLQFLHKYLLPPEIGFPYDIVEVGKDAERFIIDAELASL